MAEPSGEHVVRGGKTGGLNQYHYSITAGTLEGWSKVDDDAGQVGMNGEGGDHFSAAQGRGNNGHPQPGTQA